MSEHDELVIDDTLSIPRAELQYRATRSSGPGGQHVNTSSTRIELRWDFEHSGVLDDMGRSRLRRLLVKRLDTDGHLRVTASSYRSQLQNKRAADTRLASLVRGALAIPKKRRRTVPPKAAAERRIETKKRQSEKKKARKEIPND